MDHVLKDGLVGGAGGRPAGDAGIGEDDVEFAKIFGQVCEEPLAVFRNGDVSAVAYGQKVTLGRVERGTSKKGKGSFADRYLSKRHRDNPGDGCTMAALAQEVARSTPEINAALEQGFKEILSVRGGDRKEAIFRAAAMIGGIVLARAVRDPRLSDEILDSVRQKLR